jgi:hypothetical protein
MLPLLLFAGVIAGTDVLAQSETRERRDILVCYQLDIFDEVYKLNVKPHSRLSEMKEEERFDHPRQFAFSVFGKHLGTCGFGTVRPVVGTLISTLPVGQAGGARLGIESFNTTDVPNSCRDVEISCKSADEGFPPIAWECFGQNKFDAEFQFRLDRVLEHEDERCSLFEDGEFDDAGLLVEPTEDEREASGTVKPSE